VGSLRDVTQTLRDALGEANAPWYEKFFGPEQGKGASDSGKPRPVVGTSSPAEKAPKKPVPSFQSFYGSPSSSSWNPLKPSSVGYSSGSQSSLWKYKGKDDKEEKKPYVAPPKWTSAGGVIVAGIEGAGLDYVCLIKPSNNFGPLAFPKGRVENNESLSRAAKREVAEETGLHVALLPNGYLGTGEGSHSITHYFMMVRIGGSVQGHDFETDVVKFFRWSEAFKALKKASNKRDVEILMKAWKYVKKLRGRTEDDLP